MEDNKGFPYAAERLDAASRTLKRHSELGDEAIWSALHEGWHGLKEIRRDELDPLARSWYDRLDVLRGGDAPPDNDLISRFDRGQRLEVYRYVVNLSEWFRRTD